MDGSIQTIRPGVFECVALMVFAAASNLCAADATQLPSNEPLRFQRISVPADKPDEWPRDKSQRYLPVPADEFERRVRQLAEENAAPTKIPAARLIKAEYTAELSDDNLTAGTAIWHFEHRGKNRELVVFEHCRLAIDDASWIDSKQPAILGNDSQGRLAAIVEAAGKMRCSWSLRGQRIAGGQLRFDLSLPPCSVNALELVLPAGQVPTVDHGLVSLASEETTDGSPRKWRIDLGGHSQDRLRIATSELPHQQRPSPIVRNHFVYECSERGLELNAEFRTDVAGDSISQVGLLVDQPLTVVSAYLDEVEVSVGTSAGDAANQQRMSLTFPEPLSGHDRRLRIKAVAPLEYGSLQRLPLLSIADARWQQGTASLIISPPLLLEDLTTVNCRQIATESLAASLAPEAIEVQFYKAAPQIEFQLARQRDHVEVLSGASILLRSNQAVGHFHAELTATAGQRFMLEAEVAPQWTIDTVEATPLDLRRNIAPPAAPEDYVPPAASPVELVESWNFTTSRGRPGKLLIELKSPLTPQRGLALKITGLRRRIPSREKLVATDLRMLGFAETTAVRRLVRVQTTERLQVQTEGDDDLRRLDGESLSPSDAALLDRSSTGLVFVDDEGARNLSISTIAQPAKFAAAIHGDVHVRDGAITESYRATITPQGQEVDRLLVRFTQPREEVVRWQLASEPSVELSSRRLSSEEQIALGYAEGETWEIKLPVPQSKEFALRADRDKPFRGDTPIALASLLGAETQQASVQIRCSEPRVPEIRTRRLKSIPVEPAPAGQISDVLAALRYDADETSLVSTEPPLILAPRLEPSVAADAWVWQAKLASRYRNDGAEHLLTCRVENAGREQILFQLPADAELRGAWIDDRAALDPTLADPQRCQIKLPAGVRFVTVVLSWIDQRTRLDHLSQLSAPWPECAVPVLARQWTVAVPPGVQVVDADLGNGSRARGYWLQRLFGPLVRAQIDPISASAAPVAAAQETRSPVGSSAMPWKSDLKDRFADNRAWKTYQFDALPAGTAKLWVNDERSALAWFWAILAIAAAIRWSIGARQLAVEIGLLTAATVAALLVPVAWTTFSAALWLGVAGTQAFLWCNPRNGAARHPTKIAERSSVRRNLAAAGTATALLVIALSQKFSKAEEPSAASSAENNTTVTDAESPRALQSTKTQPDRDRAPVQVLIPADQNGQAVGDLYYLPESFQSWLMQQIGSPHSPPPRYLILRADYEGEQHRPDSAAETGAVAWKAIYEVESLADDAVMDLPLGFNGAALEPNGVLLDGKSANIRKSDSSDALGVELPKAGRHRLEVQFRPQHNLVGYDFAIPVAASAKIRLAVGDGALPTFASAVGVKQVDDMHNLTVALGPSARFVLQEAPAAQQATANNPTGAVFDCDQLCWLRLRPGGVVVDARYLVRVQKGRLSQLRLAVDPQLRLLPSAEGAAPLRYRSTESEPGSVVVDWTEPVVGQASVDLSFVLADATGIGDLHLPVFESRGGQTVRRLWAVNADPSLELVLHLNDEAEKISADEFNAAWGAAASKPQITFAQNGKNAAASYLAVRPAPSNRAAHYQLAAIAEAAAVELHFQATISSDSPIFQYRLKVPDSLQIEEISASDGPDRRGVRWTRCRPTAVTAFLDAPVTGERRLFVRGRMPLAGSGEFTLPDIRLEGFPLETFDSLVLRRSEALVELTSAAGVAIAGDDDAGEALAQTWRKNGVVPLASLDDARIVAALAPGKQYAPVTMSIRRNAPRTAVTQLTSLVRQADNWRAIVDVDVRVRSGVVDELRFDIPSSWTGPFEIAPQLPAHLEESVNKDQKQLVVRPNSPIAESLRLSIAGAVASPANRRRAAPQVRLHGAGSRSHFFLLPRRYEQEQLSWDTSGLIDKPLPDGFAPAGLNMPDYRSLEQVSEHYRAELRSIERGAGNAHVRLADFSLSLAVDGSSVGAAEFDLEPAGAANCPMELPAGAQLLFVRLDGGPAQLSALGENRWNVWLGESNLPRRLAVLYSLQSAASSQPSATIRTPLLVDVPIARTLWTICTPADVGKAAPSVGAAISKTDHALLRLKCTADLLQSAEKEVLQESEEALSHWYRPWVGRWQHNRLTFEQQLPPEADDTAAENSSAEVAAIEGGQAKLADRLGVGKVFSQTAASHPPRTEPGTLLESLQPHGDAESHIMLTGNDPALQADFPQRRGNSARQRFLAAAATTFVGGLLMVFARRKQIRVEDIGYLPATTGILFGLAWWLWLTPALLGTAIIVASLWIGWKSGRPVRPRRVALGSTVARFSAEAKSSQFRVRPR